MSEFFLELFSEEMPSSLQNNLRENLSSDLDKLLSEKGTIILEEPYLGSMYKKVSYDQIYDEHIYMFSLS